MTRSHKKKDYGYFPSEKPDPTAYVLGGLTSLPKIVLQQNGQWDLFLPTYEPQFNENFDSDGCTVWGTQNAIETLVKKLTDQDANYSERFTYILVPVRPPGADPHVVAECIRNKKLINQELLPMTDSFEDFLKPDPMTQTLLDEAKKWPFEFGHEYVWKLDQPQTKEQRAEKIREALQYSPLCVSVSAWYEDNGVFIDAGQPNSHWCMLYGEAPNGWKIFDSYDQTLKVISFDHKIGECKRYMLTPIVVEQSPSLSFWQKIKLLFLNLRFHYGQA